MNPPPTDTTTLIATLRELATAIQSDEGLAEAALIEAADRMENLQRLLGFSELELKVERDSVRRLMKQLETKE